MRQMELPASGFIEYWFPLRAGLTVRLVLPKDLTMAEVERLRTFMMSLVYESLEAVITTTSGEVLKAPAVDLKRGESR